MVKQRYVSAMPCQNRLRKRAASYAATRRHSVSGRPCPVGEPAARLGLIPSDNRHFSTPLFRRRVRKYSIFLFDLIGVPDRHSSLRSVRNNRRLSFSLLVFLKIAGCQVTRAEHLSRRRCAPADKLPPHGCRSSRPSRCHNLFLRLRPIFAAHLFHSRI